MRKRILSVILSAAMAFSLPSVSAWAAGETGSSAEIAVSETVPDDLTAEMTAYSTDTSAAENDLTPEATCNTGDQSYTAYYSSTVKSYLANTDQGLMRVEYTGDTDTGILVEYYDSSYQITSQKYIDFELSVFGGFYEGEDAYYLVFGQSNSDQDDSTEVVRVVKYSKDWERLGSAGLYGANTTLPFRSGSLRMAECNGYLYIRTSHLMYQSADGNYHQANLMIEVQESDMTVTDSYYSVMNNSVGYVSHSFNQFIMVDDSRNLIALDHGDAYPRAAILTKYVKQAGNSTFSGRTSYVNVFSFQGTTGTNSTGASLGGLEYSSTSYLVAGNSVTQDDDWSSHTARNVFVTVTSRSDFSSTGTEVKWITDYDTDGIVSTSTPQLVKMDTDQFLLLWTTTEYADSSVSSSKQTKLHYVFLDGDGDMTGEICTTDGQLSDCKPVVADGAAVWYVTGDSSSSGSSSSTTPVFYKITQDGTCTVYSDLENPEITGISATDSGIEVTWDAVDGAEGYYVHYNAATVTVADADTTSAVCSASSGSTYYIWVEAYAGSSKSLAVNKQKFIYIVPELTNTETGIQVDWPEVTDASACRIYRKTEDGSWTLVQTTTSVSWIDQSVSGGSAYTYRIQTVLADGSIFDSAESSMTRLLCPTLLDVTVVTNGVQVTWETVEGAAKYYVYYALPTATYYSYRTVTAGSDSTQSLTLSNLTSGSSYKICVQAYVDGTYSCLSEASTVYYLQAPTISLSNTGAGIQLNWSEVSGAAGYKVYRKTEGGSYSLVKTTSDIAWTDTEISDGIVYTYQVFAYSGDSISAGSTEVSNIITDISSCEMTLSTNRYTYDGTAKIPSVTVTYGSATLTEGTDYTVSYSNNTNAGTATVTVTGKGNYIGSQDATFTISKADQSISAAAASTSMKAGGSTSISVSGAKGAVTYASDNASVATVDSNGTVTGVSAGTATITVTAAATDNYNSATKTVTITVTADTSDSGSGSSGNSGSSGSGNSGDSSSSGSASGSGSSSDSSDNTGSSSSAGSTGTSDSASSGSDSTTSESSGVDSLCVRRGNAYYFSYTIHAGNADKVVYYGKANDEVLIGDWDGDGIDTICVRRGNAYYFKNDFSGGEADTVVYYGKAADEVLVGDWDGDGKDTLAVRRGNTYYISNKIKSGDADKVVYYGKTTDTVLVGDWDGDGKDTLAVRRGNAYYISNTIKSGNADKTVYYGKATDIVLVGDWDGDSQDTLAVRRGNIYYISNAIKSGEADRVVAYGKATDEVYAGTWK